MELVRTRLAVSSEGTYRGMADCIRRVLKYEGMRAFYRGLLPSLVSRTPVIQPNGASQEHGRICGTCYCCLTSTA